ncbi:MAG: PASTA domain-containing protein [Actinomycetota bacterium]|nr:PASTA domain-containing protein [Actinomycetota bacterium]
MSRHSSSKATILLVTMLAVGAPSACGRSASTTGTSLPTSGPPASSGHASSGGPPTSPVSANGKDAMPALAGDQVSVAELYLRQIGLRAGQMLPESNTRFQSGLVITTSPYAGDEVPTGSAVDLLVSDGYPGCQPGITCSPAPTGASAMMPDVIGQTVAQATTTLALDGITLGSSVVGASSAPKGTIICTVPPTGTPFRLTTPVDVGVSSGDPGSPALTLCGASTGPASPSGVPPSSQAQPSPSS